MASPADRIKQLRRAAALASLHLATNGALLNAWNNEKIPENTKQLLRTGWVNPQDLQYAEGSVEWNGKLATSEQYGTIHFATPLVESPIEWITADEKAEYERFRSDYMRLWRRFFDPVGMRFIKTAIRRSWKPSFALGVQPGLRFPSRLERRRAGEIRSFENQLEDHASDDDQSQPSAWSFWGRRSQERIAFSSGRR